MTEHPDAIEITDLTKEDPSLEIFEALVEAEAKRRTAQRNSTEPDIRAYEQQYFGPEVGSIRAAFNATMLRHMRQGGDLLDYGSGGSWWKSEYWPHYDKVHAAEVDASALREIAATFPDVSLILTRNGIIETTHRYDVVLSSSVVGYILPAQAEHHIKSCFELLKPGGQLVMTRVLAHSIVSQLKASRLVHVGGTSFAYHYTNADLVEMLQKIGFTQIKSIGLGIRIPVLSWRVNQMLYRHASWLMTVVGPRLFPFFKIQHMLIAEKPAGAQPRAKA